MATLFGQQARFPLRMTPEGVMPGSTGTIFDVEQLPILAGPGPKVRVQIDDYKSDWIFPAQLEILTATTTKAGWYIERWAAGCNLRSALAEKSEIQRVMPPRDAKREDLEALEALGFMRAS